jgi:hypothetical protein
MNAAVLGTPQARAATWATAAMTVLVMSMAFVLGQRKRQAAMLVDGPGVALPESRRSRAGVPLPRSSQLPGSPRRRHARPTSVSAPLPRRPASSAAEELPEAAPAMTEKVPGLRLNHGMWGIIYVPYVSEGACFVLAIVAIALTQYGHLYAAIALLVLVFFFRLKIIDTYANAPMLSEASKLLLLKSLNRETLHELLREDLPRWVNFPDVEKCDWLNHILDTLWPYVKVALARTVKDALTPALETLKTKLRMTHVGFRGLDLGTAAPAINGIKTLRHLEEQVVIDIDLLIATQNSDVVFSFGNPASHIHMNIELSDFLLRGTLRIVMKPLFPRWPTFGAVAISFTEKPTINFHLKTLHLNLMELPALSSMFHSAIRSAIENALVWPNKLLIPLVEDLSKLEIESLASNKPLGMLAVKNLRLQGVQPTSLTSRWTGMHNFHLQLSVGKEKAATDVVRGQTSHNFADESFYLLVLDPKTQDLNLALNYKEAFGTTRAIDTKWIHLDHLERHVTSNELVAFGRDGVGRAEFDLVWYPFSGLTKSQRRQSRDAPLPVEIASMGAVFIKLLKCERLPAMDMNGYSDPYVIFRVGSRKKTSSIKVQTLNPVRSLVFYNLCVYECSLT